MELGATTGPKQRRRIITEARKEQNRIAQQQYRQRLKDRARNRYNHQSTSAGRHRPLVPHPSHDLLPRSDGELAFNHGVVGAVEIPAPVSDNTLFHGTLLQPDLAQSSDRDCLDACVSSVEVNTGSILPFTWASPNNFSGLESRMPLEGYGLQVPCMAIDEAEANSANGHFASNCPSSRTSDPGSPGISSAAIWPAAVNTRALGSYLPDQGLFGDEYGSAASYPLNARRDFALPSIMSTNVDGSEDLSSEDLRRIVLNSLSSQLPGLQDMISATLKFLNERRMASLNPLPNLYINYLQCTETTTLLACYFNAPCIGLDYRKLIRKSPFVRSDVTVADDPQILLAAARKPWIPIHLQPTLPQILIPHQAFVDLLPFPVMRERIITLSSTAPQLFQPMEFKRDVLRGGLYCLRDCNEPGGRQPWDIRSWQTAPWFLKKWRLLIG